MHADRGRAAVDAHKQAEDEKTLRSLLKRIPADHFDTLGGHVASACKQVFGEEGGLGMFRGWQSGASGQRHPNAMADKYTRASANPGALQVLLANVKPMPAAKSNPSVVREVKTPETKPATTAPSAPLVPRQIASVAPQTAGAELLNQVERFLARFISYPSEAARVAHTTWITHTHLMDAWDSTPRIAFLSAEPKSGKSRALEITATMVPDPVLSSNASAAYLIRRISSEDARPTILYDEIDTVFGPARAKENEDIRGFLNAGHRRSGMAHRCAIRGKSIEPEDLPAYGAVAMAGLGNLPDTILTRSVVVRMKRRAAGETVEPYRERLHAKAGNEIRERLAAWATSVSGKIGNPWPDMPTGIVDRDADVWESLFAVADAAGGDWPRRLREAAAALLQEGRNSSPSLGVRLLRDLREVFTKHLGDRTGIPTEEILRELTSMTEAPWKSIKGEPLDPLRLANLLKQYEIKPGSIRNGEDVIRGYKAADLHDPWQRYLRPSSPEAPTPATPATQTPDLGEVV